MLRLSHLDRELAVMLSTVSGPRSGLQNLWGDHVPARTGWDDAQVFRDVLDVLTP